MRVSPATSLAMRAALWLPKARAPEGKGSDPENNGICWSVGQSVEHTFPPGKCHRVIHMAETCGNHEEDYAGLNC